MRSLGLFILSMQLMSASTVALPVNQQKRLSSLVACGATIVERSAVTNIPLQDSSLANDLRSLSQEFSELDVRIVNKLANSDLLVMFSSDQQLSSTFAQIGQSPLSTELAKSSSGTYSLRNDGTCNRWTAVSSQGNRALEAKLAKPVSKRSRTVSARVTTECSKTPVAELTYTKSTAYLLFYDKPPDVSLGPVACEEVAIEAKITLPSALGARRLVLLGVLPGRPTNATEKK